MWRCGGLWGLFERLFEGECGLLALFFHLFAVVEADCGVAVSEDVLDGFDGDALGG